MKIRNPQAENLRGNHNLAPHLHIPIVSEKLNRQFQWREGNKRKKCKGVVTLQCAAESEAVRWLAMHLKEMEAAEAIANLSLSVKLELTKKKMYPVYKLVEPEKQKNIRNQRNERADLSASKQVMKGRRRWSAWGCRGEAVGAFRRAANMGEGKRRRKQ